MQNGESIAMLMFFLMVKSKVKDQRLFYRKFDT